MKIITLDNQSISVKIISDSSKRILLEQYNGRQNELLKKKWTARTYTLSDGRVLLEFYDRQAAVINNTKDLERLHRVRFVKNNIFYLKKNISYKIELSQAEAIALSRSEKVRRLPQYKSDYPGYGNFEVYSFTNGQLLFLDKSTVQPSSAIYADIKTLANQHSAIENEVYGQHEEESMMRQIASGDRLPDYENTDQLIYPKYLPEIIKKHQLKIIDTKIFVSEFRSNLYYSSKGYYALITEEKQKNGSGKSMPILTLRFYDSLQQIEQEKKKYADIKKNGIQSEHFYQNISDRFGKNFVSFIPELIDSLPSVLNFEREELTVDSAGLDLADEAIRWNFGNSTIFNAWLPGVLAFYGECFIAENPGSKWSIEWDDENKVWIPVVKLKDDTAAWNCITFIKSIWESPMPLRLAGDWDGFLRKTKVETLP